MPGQPARGCADVGVGGPADTAISRNVNTCNIPDGSDGTETGPIRGAVRRGTLEDDVFTLC
jgi:hypothetical protein